MIAVSFGTIFWILLTKYDTLLKLYHDWEKGNKEKEKEWEARVEGGLRNVDVKDEDKREKEQIKLLLVENVN